MSGSRETTNASKDDEITTPKTFQGEEGKETNTGNRRGNESLRRMEIVQIHTTHIYFKGDTP